VLLKSKSNSKAIPLLCKLRPGDNIRTGGAKEVIAADDVIGKAVREVVISSRGNPYRIHEPSLAEYTDLSSRLVTPVSFHFFLIYYRDNADCN
jgi:tRNA (adenine57-N1/adenine58-N1)-methyltransferase